MKFRYKLEDFEGMFNHSDCKSAQENQRKCIDDAVRRCNRLLEAHEKTLPKMRCRCDDEKWAADEHIGFARVTHTALLWGIEEVK